MSEREKLMKSNFPHVLNSHWSNVLTIPEPLTHLILTLQSWRAISKASNALNAVLESQNSAANKLQKVARYILSFFVFINALKLAIFRCFCVFYSVRLIHLKFPLSQPCYIVLYMWALMHMLICSVGSMQKEGNTSWNYVAHFHFLLICCSYQLCFCVFINLAKKQLSKIWIETGNEQEVKVCQLIMYLHYFSVFPRMALSIRGTGLKSRRKLRIPQCRVLQIQCHHQPLLLLPPWNHFSLEINLW